MRINQPVTGKEILLDDHAMIVSKTDLKGRITYVNKDFLDISGFTAQELIGEPHNIVRHPDMPPQAFEDLWNALKAGRPWVGHVKNRCKNGDHYWVEAHAAPIWENGQVTGYMSVRRKPSRDAVAACEKAYREFREDKAHGRRILDGRVVGCSPLARLGRRLRQSSLTVKLVLGCAVAAVVVMGLSAEIVGRHMSATLEERGFAELRQNLGLIRGMIEVRANAMKREAMRLNDILASQFPGEMSLEARSDESLLKHGGTVLNGRFHEVDAFTAASGAAATLFVRQGDDFLRVATSLKKENGERAFGTLLGKEHPAYARAMAGERYLGKAKLFGKDYYTAYQPIKDAAGAVVGLFFIGMDITAELKELNQHVKTVKVGSTGYFFVLDAKSGKEQGMALIHPAKEGQVLLGAKDADGRTFIKEMIDRTQGEMRYPWANSELGDTRAREKVAVFDTLGDWQWLVGGGTYVDEFEAAARTMKQLLGGVSLAIGLILVGIIIWLVRAIVYRPLDEQILPAFQALSAGKYDNVLDIARCDEIGKVMWGMETMQNRLGFEVAESKRVADEMARIKIALDGAAMPLTISNERNDLIYMNQAARALWTEMAPAMAERHPGFGADWLMGRKVADYFDEEDARAAYRAELNEPRVLDVMMAGHTLRVTATPVRDAHGQYLGRASQWLDRTQELLVEREVQGLIFAAAQGDFTRRLALEGKKGFFEGLATGLNQLLDTAASGLNAVAEVLNSLASGDLTRTMSGDYQGT
ncbi:MAG: Cache 3/Cache 2 fusion domain-containing protein, partial [Rhizobium sp.]|nr:Cache 3/Cache 2 fusion domain-containing protein [Rhizobium sp.]